jgi:hypothetical protein
MAGGHTGIDQAEASLANLPINTISVVDENILDEPYNQR